MAANSAAAIDASLITTILSLETPPSRDVLRLLLNLLVDAPFDLSRQPPLHVANPHVLPYLLTLVSSCEAPVQRKFYELLHRLVSLSPHNLDVLSKASLLPHLLTHLPTSPTALHGLLLQLIQVAASHHASVDNARALFLSLTPATVHARCLLASLHPILAYASPRHYFDLSGLESGLFLAPLHPFPTSSYTFWTHVRITALTSPAPPTAAAPPYMPRLFSFRSRDGTGVDAYFVPSRDARSSTLSLRTLMSNNQIYESAFDFPFLPNTWYSVAITHAHHVISRSEAHLYVDGTKRSSIPLRYFRLASSAPPMTSCSLGCSLLISRSPGDDFRVIHPCFASNPLRGQLCSTYVFADALSPQKIAHLHALGPDFVYTPAEASLEDEPVAAYSPMGCRGDTCFNNAPAHRGDDAVLLSGVYRVARTPLREALQALGGPSLLFLLFSHLDQPLQDQDNYQVDLQLNSTLLNLLASLLESPAHRTLMARERGFAIINFLLRQVSPQHMTPSALRALVSLERLLADDPYLLRDLYTHFFLDFRLWIFSPSSTLLDLLRIVYDRTKAGVFTRDLVTVSALLDALREHFWFQPGDPRAVSAEPPRHRVTNEPLGQRPSQPDLVKMRALLLQTAEELLVQSTQQEDVQRILHDIEDLADPDQLCGIVQLILTCVKRPISEFNDLLHTLGGFSSLVLLLSHRDNSLRVLALGAIGSFPVRIRNHGFHALQDALAINKPDDFNDELYDAIFALVDIHTINICRVLLAAVRVSPGGPRCVRAKRLLKDLLDLVGTSPPNRTALLTVPGWAHQILALIVVDPDLLLDDGVLLLATLTAHRFGEKDGWRSLLDVDSQLLLINPPAPTLSRIRRALYQQLIRFFLQNLDTLFKDGDGNSPAEDNLLHVIVLLEEHLFYQVRPGSGSRPYSLSLGLDRDEQGHWRDAALVDQLLSIYDVAWPRIAAIDRPTGPVALRPAALRPSDGYEPKPGGLFRIFLRVLMACLGEQELLVRTSTLLESRFELNAKKAAFEEKKELLRGSELGDKLCEYLVWKLAEKDKELRSVGKYFWTMTERVRTLLMPSLVNGVNASAAATDAALLSVLHTLVGSLRVCMQTKEGIIEVATLMREILHRRPQLLSPESDAAKDIPGIKALLSGQLAHVLQLESNIETFLDHYQQTSWQQPFAQLCAKAHSAVSISQRAFAEAIHRTQLQARLPHATRSLAAMHEFSDADREMQVRNVSMRNAARMSEESRYELVLRGGEERERARARAWRTMYRRLTSDRDPADAVVYWKLDKYENPSRMRRRLRRNYDFVPPELIAGAPAPAASSSTSSEVNLAVLDKIEVRTLASRVELHDDDAGDDHQPTQDPPETWSPLRFLQNSGQELSVDCQMVSPQFVCRGTLRVTATVLSFSVDRRNPFVDESQFVHKNPRDHQWSVSQLSGLHQRRYRLQQTALEFFFLDRSNYLLNFESHEAREAVAKRIVKAHPPNLVEYDSRGPAELVKRLELTERWQRREMSNFDYLMQLNKLAGRSYNDLSQYPVFPWVIADYVSARLDLDDPGLYRDLSRPIGALNEKRLVEFLRRYHEQDKDSGRAFMYGTHYSSAFSVFYYLVRLEPFMSQFLTYNRGFDKAERMFTSIAKCWEQNQTSPSSVIELTPEFFYQPEFLENVNGYRLGVRQDGREVGDVELPPWASSPEEFVEINRKALESDYVSEHLHEWIDLIFGFKQQGDAAVQANNVFHYASYEGAVDIAAIEDDLQREAVLMQIAHFGQTPQRLFDRPHPSRDPRSLPPTAGPVHSQAWRTHIVRVLAATGPVVCVKALSDRCIAVSRDYQLARGKWALRTAEDEDAVVSQWSADDEPATLGLPYGQRAPSATQMAAVSQDGRTVITAGHWDNTIKTFAVESGKLWQSISLHLDTVTCLQLASDESLLASGSVDCTVVVWETAVKGRGAKQQLAIKPKPRHVLCGHVAPVTAVGLCTSWDTIASASEDGCVNLHSLIKGQFLRTIKAAAPCKLVQVDRQDGMVVGVCGESLIRLWSINGKHLADIDAKEKPLCMLARGGSLITGGQDGSIAIRTLGVSPQVVAMVCDADMAEVVSVCEVTDSVVVAGMGDGRVVAVKGLSLK